MKPLVIKTGFFTNLDESTINIILTDCQPVTINLVTPQNNMVPFSFIFDVNNVNKSEEGVYTFRTPFIMKQKNYFLAMTMSPLRPVNPKRFKAHKIYVNGFY
jgi:hypothetical protein